MGSKIGGNAKPAIAICGFSIESSTYTPYINGEKDFAVLSGDDLFIWYPFLRDKSNEIWKSANWKGFTRARSIPGGAIDKDFYKRLKSKIISDILEFKKLEQLDGILFDIHGAASVQGLDDPEGDLAKAVREAAGDDVIISATLDLHGNVTDDLLNCVDLLTCYRMAPHEDATETKERAAKNLISVLHDKSVRRQNKDSFRLPYKAKISIPVLLPGEKTSTRVEPAKGFYKSVEQIADMDGILDCSLFMGYPWADQVRCQAYIVITGFDKKIMKKESEALAKDYWKARSEFKFVGPAAELSNAVPPAVSALQRGDKPFFISDSGDNPTAGGAGDSTHTLSEILYNPNLNKGFKNCKIIYSQIWDEDIKNKLEPYSLGDSVSIKAGAKYDSTFAGPVELNGELYSIKFPSAHEQNIGDYTDSSAPGGLEAVIKVKNVFVIISEKRKPYHHISDFESLKLDWQDFDIVFVKIGYLEPELFAASKNGKNWIMALTRGGVDQRIEKLPRKNALPNLFPMDKIDEETAKQIESNLVCQFFPARV